MNGALLDTNCPRCGGSFACGANAGHCDCFGIRLTDRLRTALAAQYPNRCLCVRCLRELVDAAELPDQPPPPGASQA
ncbi:cysteine-rich CWC family protein [Roseateles sp. DC23W]|uniref:Cysteine-rich CWC family protein n=1 Tax=Pelomonas dachongensis TaxID=3299029 RepID=A0ABW7ER32_9BURK